MTVNERREEILCILRRAEDPVPAKQLAARFQVSRQVIVQDMAVIRASNAGIASTYRGYVVWNSPESTREFKVCHGEDDTERELNLIVDCGGKVKNVSISHRIYGRISAEMDVQSRWDVSEFMKAITSGKSTMLSNATSGYHYHLIQADSEERLDLIERELQKAGFLAPFQPWELETQEAERKGKES